MATTDTSQFKNGLKLELDGQPFTITYFQHVKPGKGGAFVRTKVKNLLNGRTVERTGESMIFMDQETYDQIPIPPDVIGDQEQFMMEEMIVDVLFWKGNPVNVDLPNYIESKVVQSDPAVKGDTSSGALKPATLECGVTLDVPLFIKEGDVLRVDTRTGQYSERVSG